MTVCVSAVYCDPGSSSIVIKDGQEADVRLYVGGG
jgi:hypothetical protein